MKEFIVKVNDEDTKNFKTSDMLAYDKEKGCFFKVSADDFFRKYELKLNALLTKYDKQFSDMANELKRFKEYVTKETSTFKDDVKTKVNEFIDKTTENIDKMILMVETFIKGENQ